MAAREKSVISTTTTTTMLINREDYKRTKDDPAFSDWKILIGPNDWEDHLSKKEGAEKYRTSNLPNCISCSGLYELGIVLLPTQLGREAGKLKNNSTTPVYIGKADNVRARLQQYGRNGSHLDSNGCSKGELNDCKGNGLFRDSFTKGYSIVYRWVPMEKSEAERKEAQRLKTFDYPWNKRSNGPRRPNDIHQKLDPRTSKSPRFPLISKKLQFLPHRQVDLKINSSKSLFLKNGSNFYTTQVSNDAFSQIFKFGRSQPRLVSMRYLNEDRISICGVDLGRGSACLRQPVEGRKRCAEHKWMKINGFVSQLTKEVKVQGHAKVEEHFVRGPILESRNFYKGTVCGVDFEDGTFCTKPTVLGRQRCEEHKGMRVKMYMPKSKIVNIPSVFTDTSDRSLNNTSNISVSSRTIVKSDSSLTCGATTCDGSFCKRKPDEGSKWCWQHAGTRVNGPAPKPIVSEIPSIFAGSGVSVSLCGANTQDGSFCRRKPSNGAKRCFQHDGTGVTTAPKPLVAEIPSIFAGSDVSVSTCGATTQDGSLCRRKPSNGSKRCFQHDGKGVTTAPKPLITEIPRIFAGSDVSFSTCGAMTQDGSSCRRKLSNGAKRCFQHDGTWVTSNSRTSYGSVSYFSSSCGAITHKGTPCSRAPAKGRQRCYQH